MSGGKFRRIRLGMIGGGEGAFIGAVHRIAARLDDRFELVAGAFSSDPSRSSRWGVALGLPLDRVYPDFAAMASSEGARSDGVDVVAVVTPNDSHHRICKEFLSAGIDVICDKPLTATLAEARDLAATAARFGRLLILTYNYSGYPMVREARARIAAGELGEIRVVQVEYAQDWLTSEIEKENQKQALWRTDPKRGGAGGCLADIGTHACHLVAFATGQKIEAVSAEVSTFAPSRLVPDNAQVMLRLSGGARGALWVSQVAPGNRNGLRLRIYGTKGGLEWEQEMPERLVLSAPGGPSTTHWKGQTGLAAASDDSRLPSGHPEGYLEAFATIYSDAAELIGARIEGRMPDLSTEILPMAADGVAGLAFVEAALESAANDGQWTKVAIID